MRHARRKLRRSIRRRLFAACTLVSYLIASLGIPLPAMATAKDSGQAFPCQHHGCGCHTAEQCWARCCCFTPEQRWAWAEAQQVQPPSYAEKPADTGWRSARKRDQESTCCKQKQRTSSCCQTSTEPRPAPKPEVPKPGKPKSTTPPAKGDSGWRWALGISAPACQGNATLWASTASVVPPAPPLAWVPYMNLVERLFYADESARILAQTPPLPPPRSTSVC
jgi:hypothetical protein